MRRNHEIAIDSSNENDEYLRIDHPAIKRGNKFRSIFANVYLALLSNYKYGYNTFPRLVVRRGEVVKVCCRTNSGYFQKWS